MIAAMDYIARNMAGAHAAGLAPIKDERARFAALVDILWAEYVKPVGVARIELILASRSDPVCGPRFAGLILDLDRRHKDVVWPLASRLGFTDRDQVDAIVQFYAAAIRGLAIDHLQPGLRAGAEAGAALLRETLLAWADAARP
jgi:hypothetical protein